MVASRRCSARLITTHHPAHGAYRLMAPAPSCCVSERHVRARPRYGVHCPALYRSNYAEERSWYWLAGRVCPFDSDLCRRRRRTIPAVNLAQTNRSELEAYCHKAVIVKDIHYGKTGRKDAKRTEAGLLLSHKEPKEARHTRPNFARAFSWNGEQCLQLSDAAVRQRALDLQRGQMFVSIADSGVRV